MRMQRGLVGLFLTSYKTYPFKEIKRYAGHNKWSNIKHDKANIDRERAELFQQYRRRMRAAILEGGSANPFQNKKLAVIIEQAKKSNMPAAAINTFLEKKGSTDFQNGCIEVRGPGASSLVIQCHVLNMLHFKNEVQSILKKYGCKADPTLKNLYQHKGVIFAQKDCSLDTATEDAINAAIEDVEEVMIDGKQTFLFHCNPSFVDSISNTLRNNGYNIVSADEEYIPLKTVVLSREQLDIVDRLCERIYKNFGDQVIKINDNIDYSECLDESK